MFSGDVKWVAENDRGLTAANACQAKIDSQKGLLCVWCTESATISCSHKTKLFIRTCAVND